MEKSSSSIIICLLETKTFNRDEDCDMDVDDKETNKLGKSSSSENETDEEFQDLINQFCDGIN